jgi:hypothetical protein
MRFHHKCFVTSLFAVAMAHSPVLAQQPSTAKGEWPYYTAI